MTRTAFPWLLAGAGLPLAAVGWALEPARFYSGWLAGSTLLSAWTLGSLALLLIHPLTGGRWGESLRPVLRLGLCAFPVWLVALLPILAGLTHLFPWARAGIHLDNAAYLNLPFFLARLALYLIVWLALAVAVLAGAAGRIAAPGLFVLAVTFTFFAIDTTLSLDPHFFSSIYGMIAACGAVLFALTVAILVSGRTAPADQRADLGKLLLALVILWIYLDFMQLLIVWQSNLADEAPWYLARSRGFWGAMRLVIAVGHFVLPFLLLLSPRMQRSPRALAGTAALLIGMEVLRTWWLVLPAFGRGISWIDVAIVAGLGGAAWGSALWVAQRPALATRMRHV